MKRSNGNTDTGERTTMVLGTTTMLETTEVALHPAWRSFLRHCQEIGHGEIERLKIQDGLPVLAEMTKKKVKFAG